MLKKMSHKQWIGGILKRKLDCRMRGKSRYSQEIMKALQYHKMKTTRTRAIIKR